MTASPQQTDRAVIPDAATTTQVYRIVIKATARADLGRPHAARVLAAVLPRCGHHRDARPLRVARPGRRLVGRRRRVRVGPAAPVGPRLDLQLRPGPRRGGRRAASPGRSRRPMTAPASSRSSTTGSRAPRAPRPRRRRSRLDRRPLGAQDAPGDGGAPPPEAGRRAEPHAGRRPGGARTRAPPAGPATARSAPPPVGARRAGPRRRREPPGPRPRTPRAAAASSASRTSSRVAA